MFWQTKRKREAEAERAREHEQFLRRLGEVLDIRLESPAPPEVGVRNTRAPVAAVVCAVSFE
jgi:hypothetical protein